MQSGGEARTQALLGSSKAVVLESLITLRRKKRCSALRSSRSTVWRRRRTSPNSESEPEPLAFFDGGDRNLTILLRLSDISAPTWGSRCVKNYIPSIQVEPKQKNMHKKDWVVLILNQCAPSTFPQSFQKFLSNKVNTLVVHLAKNMRSSKNRQILISTIRKPHIHHVSHWQISSANIWTRQTFTFDLSDSKMVQLNFQSSFKI